jgi:hypothetical protein
MSTEYGQTPVYYLMRNKAVTAHQITMDDIQGMLA